MESDLFSKFGSTYIDGKVIFNENEPGDRMYIIQEGNVRISKHIGGREHILTVLGKGDFFGEMAIVNRTPRSAKAMAVGTVRLLSFDREGFLGMIEKNGRLALNIIDKLCRRLQQADLQIQHLVKRNKTGLLGLNLQYAFLEFGGKEGLIDYAKFSRDNTLNLEIPQEDVAAYLKKLADDAIIAIEENKIRLLNREKLVSASDFAYK